MFDFKISKRSDKSKARLGALSTPSGIINTPIFMPVGTVAAVKTMLPKELRQVGAEIILSNTYHLYLRPGHKEIEALGGLHKFMNWEGPILTDSGGYQVFSLGAGLKSGKKLTKISEKGVKFYSHLDGSEHFMTPEKSIQIQKSLGSDIVMCFDDCPESGADKARASQAVDRSIRWWERCEKEGVNEGQTLVPICQGSVYEDLRKKHCQYINKSEADILAIGGVSVGESKEDIYKVTDWCTDVLDAKRPRYLMGIGYPEDMVEAVYSGIDMFDCVLPTRLARHGSVWVWDENKNLTKIGKGYKQVDITKSKHKDEAGVIDEDCGCQACAGGFQVAYLRHLLKEKELLGIHLLTMHNLNFVFDLIGTIKAQIKNNSF